MYYIKTPNGNVEITDENVFTKCPICSEEHQVGLTLDTNLEGLEGTSVICADCTAIRSWTPGE